MSSLNDDIPITDLLKYQVKELKIENGKNLAYIAELEDTIITLQNTIKQLKTNCTEYLKDERINQLNKAVRFRDLEISELKKFRDKLLNKLFIYGIR